MSGVGVHDDGPDGDQRLARMLFAAEARADPYPLYRQVEVPGCRHAAAAAMLDEFGALLDERAASPREDLMSLLAADAPADDEGRADLLANCIFFVQAGSPTAVANDHDASRVAPPGAVVDS